MNNPIYRGAPHPYSKMITQFDQFKQSYIGNAQAEVQKLIESGQMSQQEYNQIRTMAQQIMPYIKG